MSNLPPRLTYYQILMGTEWRKRRKEFWVMFTIFAAFGVSIVLLALAVWGKL